MLGEQYELPKLDFIAGETQDLRFRVFFHANRRPYDMTACATEFAVVGAVDKTGVPILKKTASIVSGGIDPANGNTIYNVISVKLTPRDTVRLSGKFVYQISIKGKEEDEMEQMQGVMYIRGNINKSYVLD